MLIKPVIDAPQLFPPYMRFLFFMAIPSERAGAFQKSQFLHRFRRSSRQCIIVRSIMKEVRLRNADALHFYHGLLLVTFCRTDTGRSIHLLLHVSHLTSIDIPVPSLVVLKTFPGVNHFQISTTGWRQAGELLVFCVVLLPRY